MTVKDIIKEYLIKNGYDGLYYDDCGCVLEDFYPCSSEAILDCCPGYKTEFPNGKCDCGEGCDYHIGPDRKSK